MTFRKLFEYGKRYLKGEIPEFSAQPDSRIAECSSVIPAADAETDAFFLLEYAADMSKAEYYLRQLEKADEDIICRYKEAVYRRRLHEPCQYIAGETEFMGLRFRVTPDVLIPRQDTELLAETAIDAIKKTKQIKVLDLCTGSGALAVSIKHFCPEADVTAADLSEAALKIAKENAGINETEIRFLRGDLFKALDNEETSSGKRFDIIVSNPPYVTENEFKELMPEVREYEPEMALLAGPDGLDFYRKITEQAGTYLNPQGKLLLEIGCSQAEAVSRLLEKNCFHDIRVLKDLSGNDRVVTATAENKMLSERQGSENKQHNNISGRETCLTN